MRSIRSRSLLAVAAASAVALSACSSSSAAGVEAADEPVDGGAITVAIDSDPGSQFDIHVTGTDIAANVLRGVFDSLIVQDADGSFEPWLATSWEVSPDGLEYTFTLRDDVLFHDGEAFDAEAVKANFDHVTDPETKSQYAAGLLGGDAYESTEVVDSDTVRINLSRPYAPLLQSLSTTYLGFYSPAVLSTSADKLIAGGPEVTVGTGPFKFTGYVPGQEVNLTKNEEYDWAPANATHTGPAHIDTLTYRILPENSVRSGALTSGEVDVASSIATGDVEAIRSDPTITVTSTPAPGLPYSIFLNHSRGIFTDNAVRVAFERGIDITSAVAAVYGGEYERAWSVLSPTTPGAYDSSLEGTWEYDADVANELLDEAGWTDRDPEGFRTKDGERLSATWPSAAAPREDRKSLIDAFQADLKEIGFELRAEPLDPGAYIDQLYAGTYDIADWSFVRPDGDILRLHMFSEFAPIQNASFIDDPEVDEWVVRASESTDPDERAAIYGDVQRWAVEDAAIIPIYVPSQIVGAASHIGGLRADISGSPLLYDAWTARS